MAKNLYMFKRCSFWTWRRHVAAFSTKIEHLQLSLGTKSLTEARMLGNRLNYEFDRVTAAMQDGLTYEQSKTYLAQIIQDETRKISSRRLTTRMNPIPGIGKRAVTEDWATTQAYGLLAHRGLDALTLPPSPNPI